MKNIEIAKRAAIKLRKLAKEINLQPFELEEWQNYKNIGKLYYRECTDSFVREEYLQDRKSFELSKDC